MHIINNIVHIAITRSVIFLCFSAFSAHAVSVTLPYSFTAGSPISASQMMGNFTSITSALSSTVSSPWVLSSSNIYFNTGAVGIGSSAPTRALDVNGSVAVSGSVAATAYAGISTSFSGVTNVTINIDLSTYQMVEIILNVGFSGANYPDLLLKENSSANFNNAYGAVFFSYNSLTTPATDNANILMKHCEASASYQWGGGATIRIYKPPVPGATSSAYPIEAHGTYTYGGVGPTSLTVATTHYGSTPLPSIYLATSNGALMSGTYIIHNNL